MNRLVLSLILIVTSVAIFGQQQTQHSAKSYISPDGKLFLNKSLPVYLWLSTSPDDGAKKHRLESEISEKFSNPMYFDTEGRNTVRSPSAVDTSSKQVVYPLQDIIFEVYTDSKPPYSSLKYGGAYMYKKDGKYFTKKGLEINIKSVDEISGVEDVYYSINKEQFKKYTEKITLSEESEFFIQYYAVDNVGNIEKVRSITFVTDGTSPKTALNFEGDHYNDIFSARSSISIDATDDDAVLATYYQIDDGQKAVYKYPLKLYNLKQGEHTLKYYSIDKVKNEESVNTYSFYVDKTAPTIVEELLGNSFISNGKEYSSGRTKFKITTFDNKAGVKEVFYSINGKEYVKYEKPFYLDNSAGRLSIRTYAVDNVNNKSFDNSQSDTKVDIPYIDLSGPTLDYTFIGPMFESGDTVFISQKSRIKLFGKDPESGLGKVEYKINEGQMLDYTEPFSISEEGRYTVFYVGTDNVNNKNQNEFVVIVDNIGPEIYSRFSNLSQGKKNVEGKSFEVYPEHVVLFLSSTDNFAGFEKMYYSINGQTEKLYSGLINSFKHGNDYSLKIRALDKLGNETSKNLEFSTSF